MTFGLSTRFENYKCIIFQWHACMILEELSIFCFIQSGFYSYFHRCTFSDVLDLAKRYQPPKVSKRIQVKLLNYVVVEYCDFQYLPKRMMVACI